MAERPNWELIKAATEELAARSQLPFTRKQLIEQLQKQHPDRQRGSLDPMIQGMTVNLKGGAPGAVGHECLRSVGRGLFVLDGSSEGKSSPDISVQRDFRAAPSAVRPKSGSGETARTVVLVGCVKSKQQTAVPARVLYTSSLFLARRRFAEHFSDRWFILSALHGLVDPEQTLAPYEQVLTAGESREWARRVFASLEPHLQEEDRVVI